MAGDDRPSTVPELLEAIDYDPDAAARHLAAYLAMIGLGVVLGAIFTAVLVANAMEPIGVARVGPALESVGPSGYRLELVDVLRARDMVAVAGLGAFVGGGVALGLLEAEWL